MHLKQMRIAGPVVSLKRLEGIEHGIGLRDLPLTKYIESRYFDETTQNQRQTVVVVESMIS